MKLEAILFRCGGWSRERAGNETQSAGLKPDSIRISAADFLTLSQIVPKVKLLMNCECCFPINVDAVSSFLCAALTAAALELADAFQPRIRNPIVFSTLANHERQSRKKSGRTNQTRPRSYECNTARGNTTTSTHDLHNSSMLRRLWSLDHGE